MGKIIIFRVLDIYSCTYSKYGQKVLLRERAKIAYFPSPSSDSDNKCGTRFLFGTLTCFNPMTIWPKILILNAISSINRRNYRFIKYIP